ncbi:MAG: outer membrane beta-barrel protein, partial [Flavisolibacter sp.]
MRILLTVLLFFIGIQLFAQQPSVTGKVKDTLENKNLHNASVSLIRKSDSTLFAFVRTNDQGEFAFRQVFPGKYYILVTYPKFVDYTDELEVGNTDQSLGTLALTEQTKLLEEVIVKQNVAIRMKGDTIEYKADSFKVQEGATVKDLLRRLPGLQVDSKGQITAQGQKVEKVLVDGEEFFSDDPAVVIENLRADAIDKVQSYDKKSDQSEFTGVDDGSRSKTLNLVLKDDKKKGYLGKVVVGGGTSERYSDQAMLNYFKGKKKVSVYGIASNTGTTGLGWEDRSKFGSGNDFDDADVEMGAGYIMINSEGDNDFSDWGNTYYDEGIPRTLKAGAHFSNKFNKDKQNINANYTINDVHINAEGNSLTKYLLPDSAYYSRESHLSKSDKTTQMLTGIYDVKIDSMSSLKFKLNGKVTHSENITKSHTQSENEELVPVNMNDRTNTANSDNKIFLGSVLWRQKFRKKGRTLSLTASHKISDIDMDGYLLSATDFLNNGVVSKTDSINQLKTNMSETITTTSKLVFTEALSKKTMLELNYVFNRTNSTSDRKSFDENNGKYEQLNYTYSNKYSLNYLSNNGGAKIQYNGKKLVANIGSNVGVSHYRQLDSTGKEDRHYSYTNLFPTSRISYKFAAQRSINFNYTGTPQPPSIEQIQPLRENIDPLFIKVGNPNLKQSFRHNFSVFFNDFKMLTGRSIWINASITPVYNAIVTSQTTVNGVTSQRYINTKGNYNYWFYGSYNFKLKKADLNTGVNLNFNGG